LFKVLNFFKILYYCRFLKTKEKIFANSNFVNNINIVVYLIYKDKNLAIDCLFIDKNNRFCIVIFRNIWIKKFDIYSSKFNRQLFVINN